MTNARVFAAAPCGKTPVCDSFYDCFYNLILPEGSFRQRVKGGSVPQNLNTIVEEALQRDCTHVFIVEDDSMFHPMTVVNLLHHDKDVVAGLCPNRNSPFMAYVYGDANEQGVQYYPLTSKDQGLIKVAATGMGGILIKTSVFAKLKKPYFVMTYEGEKEWGQDIYFAKSLVDAGIQVYCDTNVPIWHATHCALGTMFEDGQWYTMIKIDKSIVKIPVATVEGV
jgi:hypothetical protein